jgi:glutathione S-transferase
VSKPVIVYHRQPFDEIKTESGLEYRKHSSPNGIIPSLRGLCRSLANPADATWIAWSRRDDDQAGHGSTAAAYRAWRARLRRGHCGARVADAGRAALTAGSDRRQDRHKLLAFAPVVTKPMEHAMKLYYSPGACSLASHIALREAGLPFDLVKVEGRGSKTAGGEPYANVTAKGYVPALRFNDGTVLTECTAILPWIGDQKPGLAPAPGTMLRYRLHEWLGYLNSELHKGFSPFFTPGTTDEQKAAAKEKLAQRLEFVQRELGDRPFLLGDEFSVADAYLFTILGWTNYIGVDLGNWPGLKAYHARIAARPAVLAALKAEGLIK